MNKLLNGLLNWNPTDLIINNHVYSVINPLKFGNIILLVISNLNNISS